VTKLRLTLAVGDYDITRPLLDGVVEIPGVDLVTVSYPSPQRHWRMLRHREFDAAELSLGSFVAQHTSGEGDLVGIPAFPHRRFRHGYVFASTAAGITRPADLAGRSVGVRNWQTTAGVWLRGILAEHHGLNLRHVDWVAQDAEDVALDLPPGLHLRQVVPPATVTEQCAAGELAGLVYPELPRQIQAGDGTIRRVFPDPKAVEQAYYRKTGIFPIMHLVALRAEIAEAYPWVPRTLFEAFEESKRLAMRRLENPRTVSLAWLRTLQEEEAELLGRDPWHYGLDPANRTTLETFLRYAADQGVARGVVAPEDLFHAGALDAPPHYV
jgi:4,5-dihydroxyphthalate decarboxylase